MIDISLCPEYWLMEWCFFFFFPPGILTAVITIYCIGDWIIHLLQLITVFCVHMCKFFFLTVTIYVLSRYSKKQCDQALLDRGEIVATIVLWFVKHYTFTIGL